MAECVGGEVSWGQGAQPQLPSFEQATGRAYYTGDHYRTFVSLN